MNLNDYLKLKTADGFFINCCPDRDVLYSNMETTTVGKIREILENITFDEANKFLSDYYLIEENLLSLAIKDKKVEHQKLLLVYNETEKCLAEIKQYMKPYNNACLNANTVERANNIFWKGLDEAKKIAFENINPCVKPQVVYRVNWWYNLLT